jgi:hypothetical protein
MAEFERGDDAEARGVISGQYSAISFQKRPAGHYWLLNTDY